MSQCGERRVIILLFFQVSSQQPNDTKEEDKNELVVLPLMTVIPGSVLHDHSMDLLKTNRIHFMFMRTLNLNLS